MTRNEAGVIVDMISTFYPNEFAKTTPAGMKMIVDMWAAACAGYTSDQMAAALQQFVMTDVKGYAPKPGQLTQFIHTTEDDKDLSDSQAWALVKKALSNSAYGAREEFAKLPELVQRAVGSEYVLHEMALMPLSDMAVEESHFRRTYRALLEREREKRRIPPQTWKRLEGGSQEALPG